MPCVNTGTLRRPLGVQICPSSERSPFLSSIETLELTIHCCWQSDKLTVKLWKDSCWNDQISQKKQNNNQQFLQDGRVIFLETLSAVAFRWCGVLSAKSRARRRLSPPDILLWFGFSCVLCFVFRDASGERRWDDVPLCHLHLHRAAAPGSAGLQRSIPEGTSWICQSRMSQGIFWSFSFSCCAQVNIKYWFQKPG